MFKFELIQISSNLNQKKLITKYSKNDNYKNIPIIINESYEIFFIGIF